MDNIVFYELDNALYVNVTNKCTNRCVFCIRDYSGVGYDLFLKGDIPLEQMIKELDGINLEKYSEVVFCGYGEPLIRYKEVIALAKEIKSRQDIKIRINTNGHANAYHNMDITPLFSGVIDTVSISLNAVTAQKYQEICKSIYKEKGFDYMLEFAEKCVETVPEVILSVIDKFINKEDIPLAENIAQDIGAKLRIRTFSE